MFNRDPKQFRDELLHPIWNIFNLVSKDSGKKKKWSFRIDKLNRHFYYTTRIETGPDSCIYLFKKKKASLPLPSTPCLHACAQCLFISSASSRRSIGTELTWIICERQAVQPGGKRTCLSRECAAASAVADKVSVDENATENSVRNGLRNWGGCTAAMTQSRPWTVL